MLLLKMRKLRLIYQFGGLEKELNSFIVRGPVFEFKFITIRRDNTFL